jgi:hypothetical protein
VPSSGDSVPPPLRRWASSIYGGHRWASFRGFGQGEWTRDLLGTTCDRARHVGGIAAIAALPAEAAASQVRACPHLQGAANEMFNSETFCRTLNDQVRNGQPIDIHKDLRGSVRTEQRAPSVRRAPRTVGKPPARTVKSRLHKAVSAPQRKSLPAPSSVHQPLRHYPQPVHTPLSLVPAPVHGLVRFAPAPVMSPTATVSPTALVSPVLGRAATHPGPDDLGPFGSTPLRLGVAAITLAALLGALLLMTRAGLVAAGGVRLRKRHSRRPALGHTVPTVPLPDLPGELAQPPATRPRVHRYPWTSAPRMGRPYRSTWLVPAGSGSSGMPNRSSERFCCRPWPGYGSSAVNC